MAEVYEPRTGPVRPNDATMVGLKEAILAEGVMLVRMFIDMLYPEDERGRRVAILHEVVDDEREEWLFLEEVFRRHRLWKAGHVQPDSETLRFERNEGGAQERLRELREKYAEAARAAMRAAGQ